MREKKRLRKISDYGLYSESSYRSEAFSRNIGIFSAEEQHRLGKSTVAVPGMGGVGGLHLLTLVRAGIGRFNLSDYDVFEPANINRQCGATVEAFGRSKLDVMCEQALSINPYLKLNRFPEGIGAGNVDEFLEGTDVLVDGMDFFNFEIRRLLFNRALEKGIHVVTAGPMGFSSALLVFAPDKGMRFDEYFDIVDGMPPDEQYMAFALGLAPRPTHIHYLDLSRVSMENKKGPSTSIACQICAGMAATEVLRIILKRGCLKPVPFYYQFDPYLRKYRKGRLWGGNKNPIQRLKRRFVVSVLNWKKAKFMSDPPAMPDNCSEFGEASAEALDYIVSAGIRAPSGDNAQPWKFSTGQNAIDLYLDPEADDSFFNFGQAASVISCGAVLENMQIASAALGFKTTISYGAAVNGSPIARMELRPGPPVQRLPVNVIWKRRTNRVVYKRRPIPSDVVRAIKACSEEFQSTHLHIISDSRKLEELGKIVYQVDRIRSELRQLHEHLHKMIRFSDEEAVATRNGFPIKNLEAGFAGEAFLKITRRWSVMSGLNRFGASRLPAAHSYRGIRNSSAAALLTVDGGADSDLLAGGRALQRIWLTLTSCGVAMQPTTAITLFRLRWVREGPDGFPPEHRKLIEAIWPRYRALFPDSDFSRETQVMLFRLGYGRPIRCGTLRKSSEELTASPGFFAFADCNGGIFR